LTYTSFMPNCRVWATRGWTSVPARVQIRSVVVRIGSAAAIPLRRRISCGSKRAGLPCPFARIPGWRDTALAKATYWLTLIAGFALMLFGLGCLNYTKIGGVDHHHTVAEQHGWPAPSTTIAHIGMLSTPLGAGLLGWGVGRRRSKVA
jgi:hypothetical protein